MSSLEETQRVKVLPGLLKENLQAGQIFWTVGIISGNFYLTNARFLLCLLRSCNFFSFTLALTCALFHIGAPLGAYLSPFAANMVFPGTYLGSSSVQVRPCLYSAGSVR